MLQGAVCSCGPLEADLCVYGIFAFNQSVVLPSLIFTAENTD